MDIHDKVLVSGRSWVRSPAVTDQQSKVFKTDSSDFPTWRSRLWEKQYDWPASVRIMDWLSTG